MSITIESSDVERWIREGVKSSIDHTLRSFYGMGGSIQKLIEKAIKESEPSIIAALHQGIERACISPTFMKQIEQELATSLASQFRGAFEGVIRAAAKHVANNEIVARRVVELTREAAGLSVDGKPSNGQ